MQKRFLGIVLLAFMLCGFDQRAGILNYVLPDHDKAGRAYFEDVRSGNFSPIYDATAPAYKTAMTPQLFHAMQGMFGPKPVKAITVVGAHIGIFEDGGKNITTNTLTYEYDMGDRYVIAEIALRKVGDAMQIEGIHVQALTRSLEQINAFTLSGKSARFLVFLALAIAIPVFIIVTEVVCWRTPIPRRKWLWRIFVLLGITGTTLNWTDGSIQFKPVMALILGAGSTAQPYGPLMLQIGIPLGAILFWIMRRRWLADAERTAQPFA